jgi:hypothetical protein
MAATEKAGRALSAKIVGSILHSASEANYGSPVIPGRCDRGLGTQWPILDVKLARGRIQFCTVVVHQLAVGSYRPIGDAPVQGSRPHQV